MSLHIDDFYSTLATEAVSFCCLTTSSVEQARLRASSALTMQTDACSRNIIKIGEHAHLDTLLQRRI